jgi:hypothetical protein
MCQQASLLLRQKRGALAAFCGIWALRSDLLKTQTGFKLRVTNVCFWEPHHLSSLANLSSLTVCKMMQRFSAQVIKEFSAKMALCGRKFPR